jgi:hypothetical protein
VEARVIIGRDERKARILRHAGTGVAGSDVGCKALPLVYKMPNLAFQKQNSYQIISKLMGKWAESSPYLSKVETI